MTPILQVDDLDVRFATPDGEVAAVSDVSFSIAPGETLGVVGESGSGKTQIFMSIMGLLASNGKAHGRVTFDGQNLLELNREQLNKVRGSRMTMIFQDPMTSLNPYLTVERQLTEILEVHRGFERPAARREAIEMLEKVQIPEAAKRISMYPFEFSGGMRQRVMIAMALLCKPELLIADEPTTALDVTVQAQILDLIRDMHKQSGTAVALITHDLGVVAGLCDKVMVMYAGRVVEAGSVTNIFKNPQHPYTAGLIASIPRLDDDSHGRLVAIGGQPPNLQRLPPGCSFNDRCGHAFARCLAERPLLTPFAEGRSKACHLSQL